MKFSSFTLALTFLLFLFPSSDGFSQEESLRLKFAKTAEGLNPICIYTPGWQKVQYPCGDIPQTQGVCTDVVIRAFKGIDICLQKEIHEYRKSKGLKTDSHIDHRRVPNQCAYFESLGMRIPNDSKLLPGDIIWWKLNGTVNHIGIVVTNGKVMHNIGRGQRADVWPTDYNIHIIYRILEE